jgi:hypothetical protein
MISEDVLSFYDTKKSVHLQEREFSCNEEGEIAQK